jgi:hypothetical protein
MSPSIFSPSGQTDYDRNNNHELHNNAYDDSKNDNYNGKSSANFDDIGQDVLGRSASQMNIEMNIEVPSIPVNYYDNASPSQSDSREQRLESRSRRIDQVQATVEIAVAGLANVFTKRSGGSIIDGPVTEGGPVADEQMMSLGSVEVPETEEEGPTRIDRTDSNDQESSSGRRKSNEKYSKIDIESLRNKHMNSKHINTSLEDSMNSLDFKSPIHPYGSVLTLEILSTWGDSIYVGLNGIDIFDEKGDLLSFRGVKSNITSVIGNPSSISVLPEIGNIYMDICVYAFVYTCT